MIAALSVKMLVTVANVLPPRIYPCCLALIGFAPLNNKLHFYGAVASWRLRYSSRAIAPLSTVVWFRTRSTKIDARKLLHQIYILLPSQKLSI